MQVKNASKVAIEIGHTVIAPGKVENISDTLLYQPRVQALKANGDLIFPFHMVDADTPAPAEQPVTKVLALHTDVTSPTEHLGIITSATMEPEVEVSKPRKSHR